MSFYVVDGYHGEMLAYTGKGAGDYVDEEGGVVLALLPIEDLHWAAR